MWPTILSDRLPVPALVGRYPTNKLIGPRPLLKQKLESEATFDDAPESASPYRVLASVSRRYPRLQGRLPRYYSPFRRFTQAPKDPFSLDLHA